MIARAPPLRPASEFRRNIPERQLQARLAEIDVLVIQRRLGPDRRSLTERLRIADELRLHGHGGPIADFKPPAHIRLVLDAVGVIFTAPVFTQPDALMSTQRKSIHFALQAGA